MPQATVRSYDSITQTGTLVGDDGETSWTFDAGALGMFRFLRSGQRVSFDLVGDDGEQRVTNLRIGIA